MYLLVPHYDFPPDGPIVLGSIIFNPREPGESLNGEEIVEIPPISRHTSHKYDWEETIQSVKDGRIGVWARCLNILGLGGNFGVNFDATAVDHCRFDDLETTYFTPTQTYIEEAVAKPAVRSFIQGTQYAPVYMITGLKIVRGPDSQVTARRSMARGVNANFGLPLMMGAWPNALEAGDITLRQQGTKNTTFSGSSDFVIAYRLGKITFVTNIDDVRVPKYPLEKHTAGAMMGSDGGDRAKSLKAAKKVNYEGGGAVALELHEELLAAIDEDGDEECRCFLVP